MKRAILSLCLVGLMALPAFGKTVLYDFTAPWCGPCKKMAPVMEQLEREGYAVEKVDVDKNRELAERFGVKALPAFIVVKDGRVVDRMTGVTTIERLRRPLVRKPLKAAGKAVKRRPTPAWRYERAVGYRAAVVRIHCHDGGRVWSKGSGVLVRWGKRVVVITARHVVKDAKSILIDFHNGKRSRRVRVLKVDARWDCAVLDLGESPPKGIEPAEFAFGQEAKFRDGDRLESCGYGPDGKLACNSGLFKGYRHSSAAMQGPDDWMVLSGHARGGDSGGPVFDSKGRVVGVLWGTDGQEVVCVQAGRVHVLLGEAIAQAAEQQQWRGGCPGGSCQLPRRPTPPQAEPLAPLEPVDQAKLGGKDKTLLPWRKEAEANDKAQDARIEALIGLLEAQVQVRPGPSVDVQVGPKPLRPSYKPPTAAERSPLLAGLCVLGGVVAGFVVYFAGKKE